MKRYTFEVTVQSKRTVYINAENQKDAERIANSLDGLGDERIVVDIGNSFGDIDWIGEVKPDGGAK